MYNLIGSLMDYNSSYIFLRVVQAGSFSKAARQIEMPLSTVSAKVAQLEKHLGLTLLKRTTRKLSLTAEGEIYYNHAQKAFNELTQAELLTKETLQSLQGRIRLTAPVEIGMSTLTDVLADFLKIHTQVQIEVILTDRLVDLIDEKIDLALRIGSLKDSSLKSKKIGFSNQKLFATPEYLKKHSTIKAPADLKNHDCLIFTNSSRHEWILENGESKQKIPVRGPYSANNLIALHRMAIQSKGIALLPDFLCFEDLKEKRLVRVLDSWSTQKYPLNLIYPAQNYLSKNTRALIDFLSKELVHIF